LGSPGAPMSGTLGPMSGTFFGMTGTFSQWVAPFRRGEGGAGGSPHTHSQAVGSISILHNPLIYNLIGRGRHDSYCD